MGGEVDVPVALVGQEDDPLGIIRCAGESRCTSLFASMPWRSNPCSARARSLVEARQMVDDEVDDIPEDFIFVVKGVAKTDEAEEAGLTVNECLPTLFIQDRALAAAGGGDDDFGLGGDDFAAPAPAPAGDFGDFGDFGDAPAAPAPAANGDFGDFGDFGDSPAPSTDAPMPAADFGDFGETPAPAPAVPADDGFGSFGDDGFGDAPAPAPPADATPTASEPAALDMFGADFGDSSGGDAAATGLSQEEQEAAAAATEEEQRLEAEKQAEAERVRQEEAEAARQRQEEEAEAARLRQEEEERLRQEEEERLRQEEEEAALAKRHTAALSSRAERVAETLKLEKQRVESELRELKMLKTTLESRLEEQRLNLEEQEDAMLAMRKKNRGEIDRIREQGNENLANVLADFKEWQTSVNESHMKATVEEREIAQAQLAEAMKEQSSSFQEKLSAAYTEQAEALSTIQEEFKLFQAGLVSQHQAALEGVQKAHQEEMEEVRQRAQEDSAKALEEAIRNKEAEIQKAIEDACAAERTAAAEALKDKLEEASAASAEQMRVAMEEQAAQSEAKVAEALAAEREQSAAALEEERAKFSAKLEEALEAEAAKGGQALDEFAVKQREQTEEMLSEARQMWTDTLESNRASLGATLEAQESKFVEIADAARRRTAAALEAEVARNDAARQHALTAMGVFLTTAQGQLATIQVRRWPRLTSLLLLALEAECALRRTRSKLSRWSCRRRRLRPRLRRPLHPRPPPLPLHPLLTLETLGAMPPPPPPHLLPTLETLVVRRPRPRPPPTLATSVKLQLRRRPARTTALAISMPPLRRHRNPSPSRSRTPRWTCSQRFISSVQLHCYRYSYDSPMVQSANRVLASPAKILLAHSSVIFVLKSCPDGGRVVQLVLKLPDSGATRASTISTRAVGRTGPAGDRVT